MTQRIEELVLLIYPDDRAEASLERISQLIEYYRTRITAPEQNPGGTDGNAFDERDTIVIAYGDQFRGSEAPPLAYLHRFLREELDGYATGIHILPFSPYSSDDGFAVIDYREINPELGSWSEVKAIAEEFRLMADLVLNHCSSQSHWFKEFQADREPYRNYFITVAPGTDVGSVARPRALPLLTPCRTAAGEKLVWTTFGPDEVDLNFAEPAVLLEMLDIMLLYVANGVQLIGLDAIAYLWKEPGTSCLHHPNTRNVVRLYRAVMDEIAPWVAFIIETDLPCHNNLRDPGKSTTEAHIGYNSLLPSLTLDAFIGQDSTHLQQWARSLPPPSQQGVLLNLQASHDGIALLPSHGILSDGERDNLMRTVQERGGRVSYRWTPEGDVPYEMNINFLSAVADPNLPDEQRARIFLASQSVLLCIAGVPAIYAHSLIGSTNWTEGIELTGSNRAINRRKLDYAELVDELNDSASLRHRIFEGYKQLLRARAQAPAFHPVADQEIVETPPQLFAVLRQNREQQSAVLCLHNLANDSFTVTVPPHCFAAAEERSFVDLVSGDIFFPYWSDSGHAEITLEPHEVMWLRLS